MGIRGLTHFVDQRSKEILVELRISDQDVVIDGWNICHWLYNMAFAIPTQFNGDYYEFSLGIRSFFENLHACGIRPHVILDASDPDKSRAALQLRRAKDRIRSGCGEFLSTGGSMTPILAEQVFVKNLRQLGIPYIATASTDQSLANLACKLDCLLMTNDSDFFIFNLPHGVIVLDYFDCRVKVDEITGHSYLLAQVFERPRFLRFLCTRCSECLDNTTREPQVERVANLLPILAASIDFPDMQYRLKHSPGAKKSHLANGPVSAVFRVLLRALDEEDPWQAALEQLSVRIPTPSRPAFLTVVEDFQKFYCGNFSDPEQPEKPHSELLENLFAKARLSRMLCGDALTHKRVLLRCLFEVVDLRSCFDLSSRIRLELYRLLFRDNVTVVEFTRVGRKFIPSPPVEVNPPQLFLDETLAKPVEERRRYFNRCLFPGLANAAPGSIFASITTAWIASLLHCRSVSEFLVDSFLASMALCHAVVVQNVPVDFADMTISLHRLKVLENPLIYLINHMFACWQPFCLVALDLAALLQLEEDEPNILAPELFHGTLLVLVTSYLLMMKEDQQESSYILPQISKTIIPLISDDKTWQRDIEAHFSEQFTSLKGLLTSLPLQEEVTPEASCLIEKQFLVSLKRKNKKGHKK